MSVIVNKIIDLGLKRKWGGGINWCVRDKTYNIIIDRTNISKYIIEYGKIRGTYDVSMNFYPTLTNLDFWMLECIIEHIPDADVYTYRFCNGIISQEYTQIYSPTAQP